MKVLPLLTLGSLLTVSLTSFAVPVNECVVSIGTFSGTGWAYRRDHAANFGLVPGTYPEGIRFSQYSRNSSGNPSIHTNVHLRLNRHDKTISLAKMVREGEPLVHLTEPVNVKISKDCQRNYDRPVHVGCTERDLKNIQNATQKMLSRFSLTQACAAVEHIPKIYPSFKIIASLGPGSVVYLSAQDPQNTADDYCRVNGFTHATRYSKSKLSSNFFGSAALGKDVQTSFNPPQFVKTKDISEPPGGYFVFDAIECKRGEPPVTASRAENSVVDGVRENPKSDLPSSGVPVAPAGSEAAAQ